MRFSAAYYQTEATIGTHLPCLTKTQQRGLAWWVHGAILAGSACQSAILTALCTAAGERHALRQYLREWLYNGEDKDAGDPAPLAPAASRCSPDMMVIVLADRGLWSPRLFKRITDLGWHPLLRLTGSVTFAPRGHQRQRARELVPGPGHAWIGRGVAFKDQRRRAGTLLVDWVKGRADPWLLFASLAPRQVGIAWYGLRMWIELGFKALKGLGWHWDKTRRTDPERVARHWLVLAVATILTLATATRIEDAALLALPPTAVHAPPTRLLWSPATRAVSLIAQGIAELRRQFIRGRLWYRHWLRPELWPEAPAAVQVHYHDPT